MTRLGSVHDIPRHRPSVLPCAVATPPRAACRVPWYSPVAVERDGRPSPPVGAPHPPGSRRRASARCAAWQVAHAESFACRGLPAGAPRPRHGARQGRAPGAMLGRRASRLAPYRHYARTLTRASPVAARRRAASTPRNRQRPKYAIFRFQSDFLQFISGLEIFRLTDFRASAIL